MSLRDEHTLPSSFIISNYECYAYITQTLMNMTTINRKDVIFRVLNGFQRDRPHYQPRRILKRENPLEPL